MENNDVLNFILKDLLEYLDVGHEERYQHKCNYWDKYGDVTLGDFWMVRHNMVQATWEYKKEIEEGVITLLNTNLQ